MTPMAPTVPTTDRVNALPDPEQTPTVRLWPEAAKALGLGRSAAYAAAERGEIAVIRLGARIVVPTAALRRMLQLAGGSPDVPA